MPGTFGQVDTSPMPFGYIPANKGQRYAAPVYQWTPEEIFTLGGEQAPIPLWIQAVLSYSAYAQSTGQLGAIATVIGATAVDIIPFTFVVPSTVRYIVPGGYLYCVAGTNNWLQVLDYVLTSLSYQTFAGLPGRVKSPFGGYSDLAYALLSADYEASGPDTRVAFLGHSLGGVVAYLVAQAFQARRSWPVSRVVTFGCPRIGDKEYAAVGSPILRRIVNDGDPITQLPPEFGISFHPTEINPLNRVEAMQFRHSRSFRAQLKPGGDVSFSVNDESGADNAYDGAKKAAFTSYSPAHRMTEYVYRAQERMQAQRGFSMSRQVFLSQLYSAYLGLHNALGDTGRVLLPN